MMLRKILIVDDLTANRRILDAMLCKDYDILEAANGEEALDLLLREHASISAVLLDISMPGIDGYEVLSRIRSNTAFAQMPVIMITGSENEEARVKALTLGADDFVIKPYSSKIIRHCLRNNITLHEASATLDALKRDRLTGLYNREAFFDKVSELVCEQEPGYYIMACFDINRFKVINDQYGTQKGDEVLRHIAKAFKEGFEPHGGICSRISADNFAVLYPEGFQDSEEIRAIRRKTAHVDGVISPIIFSIGRYTVDDISMSPSAMYDRATLAANTVKGRYDTQIAIYDESMRETVMREQAIVLDMENALKERQFEVWFQPQYNHSTDAMIGAEALVRWRHPQRGLISPNEFIPVFEKNGFIYSLDRFVWEETCRYLRKWQDEGRSPLPVSVNISRYDLFCPDIIEVIIGITNKYELPADLLRLEITESAFAESSDHIVNIVRELIDRGFTVEIDDFGSGYSSLNTLKDVPAQILKLDMKFFEKSNDSRRGGNIVESVVRMAKWLGMSVIAEGVETLEQANYLRSIGCSYMQGYLYARPLPVEKYEEHCRGGDKEERLIVLETVENLDNNSFWNPDSMDTLIFNSYVGGACIYEYNEGKIELLRATDKYVQVIGSEGMAVEDILKLDLSAYLDEDSSIRVAQNLEESVSTKKEISAEYTFLDLPGCPHETHLRTGMRVIAVAGKRYLVYCTNENITAQRQAEKRERQVAEELQAIMDNVDLGIIAAIVEKDSARYVFANDRYYEMLGYTKEQFEKEVPSPYHTIALEDRPRVMKETSRINLTGESLAIVYDAITRDGRRRHFRTDISIGRFSGIDEPVQLSILRDITEEMETELRERRAAEQIRSMMDDMPGGFVRMRAYADGSIKPVYMNNGFCRLVGMNRDEAWEMYSNDAMAGVHPDDVSIVVDVITRMLQEGEAYSLRYRLRHAGRGYIWLSIFGRVTKGEAEETFLNVYYVDASEQVEEEERQKELLDNFQLLLSALMESTTDLSFAKDKNLNYIAVSRAFANMVGEERLDDIVGKTDYELFSPELADKYRRDDEKLLKSGEAIVDMVEDLPSADGTPHYSNTSKYVLRDASGDVIGLFGVGRDITEAVSRDSQLSLVNDSIPGGLATHVCTEGAFSAKNIKITYFNDGFCRLFGFTRKEYESLSVVDPVSMILREDRHILAKQWMALMEKGTPINCLYRAHVKDGGYKWISHRAVAVERKSGRVVINAILQDVTDQRELIEQLRISEEENHLAVQMGGNVVCRFNIADRTLNISREVAAAYSVPEKISGVPYDPIRLGMIAPESTDAYIGFFETIIRGSKAATATFQQKYLGEWRWTEAKSSTIFSDVGEPVKAVICLYDVTDRLERENIYKKWKQSLEDRPPESFTMFRCNLNKDTSYTIAAGTLLSFDFDNAGRDFNERAKAYIKQCVYEDDRDMYMASVNSDTMLAGYYRGMRSNTMEYRELLPDGNLRWLRLTIDLVEYPNSNEVEAYLMYEDIDRAKRVELKTRALAETDPLTGVLNRATFASSVEKLIRNSAPQTRHAMMLVDIDGFKQVNDVFGHGIGDQVLVDVASSLRSMMRHDDLVGRLGGDEFLIFLNDILDDNSALVKARQICALMHRSFSLEVHISGSVGIAMVPHDGMDFQTLYKKADSALYYVKGSGKDNYTFYDEGMADQHLEPEDDFDELSGTKKAEKKRRMLIVDDNRIDHALLQNIFKDEFIIEKAKDGATALIRLRHYGSAISVVLLDLMMPGMDGFAVLEKMQVSAELQAVPVIIVSGDESRDACLKAVRKGATDFITKPVDPELLRIRVYSAIGKSENEKLRARNRLLELHNEERIRYKAVMESTGVCFIECNWLTGEFSYHSSVKKYLSGTYDGRKFWHILLSDMVADTQTVQEMQQLMHHVAEARGQMSGSRVVRLKTPSGDMHSFKMNVLKQVNEYQLTNRMMITLIDLDHEI